MKVARSVIKAAMRSGNGVVIAGLLGCLSLFGSTAFEREPSPNDPADKAGKSTDTTKKTAPGGELLILGQDGRKLGVCPLKHTEVTANLTGFVGRTHVRQTFENSGPQTIEAVYVFPMPDNAAIDDMTMIVGKHRIVGEIQPKEQARQIYEAAKAAGKVASLLDQQRPNVFTQNVANVEPGAQVIIDISYTENVKLQDGVYEWVFPMTVGPRYAPAPAAPISDKDNATVGATTIDPNTVPPQIRSGHTISLSVSIDAGMAVHDVNSPSHEVTVSNGSSETQVKLTDNDTIPNKDFILHYRTATDKIEDAFLTHLDSRGLFFTLVLQPPQRIAPEAARPKELIFVIDRSGSMSGFPLAKATETMRQCIEGMNPHDTFNLMSFSFGPEKCFAASVPGNEANRKLALNYLASLYGEGGTDMLPAVREALARPADPSRVRIVCFMTDGFVDNDFEIIQAVKKHAGTSRVFAFGIGNAVNRYLLDGIALAGRGEAEYVTLAGQATAAANRFHQRINSPVLTDINIDWGGLPVKDVYPKAIPDLFSAKALTIHGRLERPASGTIKLRGVTGSGAFERDIPVETPKKPQAYEALASLWARAKVSDLMAQDMTGLQNDNFKPALKSQVVDLGMEYRLMTQFTSFVAVDEATLTKGNAQKVQVPSEMPEGVTNAAILGKKPGIPVPALGTASLAGAGRYRVTATHSVAARRGDPLLSVQAPANAQQIIAILPGGEVKRLLFNVDTGIWEARFDIPSYAQDGDYAVSVIIVLKNGTRQQLVLHYQVDTVAPTGSGTAQIVREGKPALRLSLKAGDDTERVAALLPWGERINLLPTPERPGDFSTLVPLPHDLHGTVRKVTFILTDHAHNRTAVTVDLTK